MENLVFTREETADALTIGLRTVDLMIARGEIKVRRIGRRVLIPRAEIERIAGVTTQPKTSMPLVEAAAI
ncbi:MAG: helix-turn-helix domain-containing protein [Candidatus Acidiferrales bacterium]